MNDWILQLEQSLARAGVAKGQKVVVAASGGLDSTALLHVLNESGRPLVVAHVNHGMRGDESESDHTFVADWAKRHDHPFECLKLDATSLKSGSQGVQGEARKKRLNWLEKVRKSYGAAAVLTGHHGDDQAETWLLHAMRSADPLAVKGMSEREGNVIRPFLSKTRAEILALAQKQNWNWREDSSNASDAYTRNRIRHEVLPLLDSIRPGTGRHLHALAQRTAELNATLTAMIHFARSDIESSAGFWSVEALKEHPLGKEVLLRVLADRGWSLALATQAFALIHAQVGAQVHGPDVVMIREREKLVEHKQEVVHSLQMETELHRSSGTGSLSTSHGTCSWSPSTAPKDLSEISLTACWIPDSWLPVVIRSWRDGDRIQPFGMDGHSLVSDVLTQAKISHARRQGALVMARTHDGAILWVAGYKLSEQARLHLDQIADAPGIMFNFEPNA